MRHRVIVLGAAGSIALASCSTSGQGGQAATATPLGTVRAWFAAVDSQNVGAAEALFTLSTRSRTDWVNNVPKNAFTNLRCQPETRSTGTQAEVHCTFTEAPGSWSGNPDTFWNVHLTKAEGRWLIDGYGQG